MSFFALPHTPVDRFNTFHRDNTVSEQYTKPDTHAFVLRKPICAIFQIKQYRMWIRDRKELILVKAVSEAIKFEQNVLAPGTLRTPEVHSDAMCTVPGEITPFPPTFLANPGRNFRAWDVVQH